MGKRTKVVRKVKGSIVYYHVSKVDMERILQADAQLKHW